MPIAPLKSNQINPNTDMKDKINEIIAFVNTLESAGADITALQEIVGDGVGLDADLTADTLVLNAWHETGLATDSFDAAGSEVATIAEGLITALA